MENIKQIPRDLANVIPKFDGDEKLLNLFIRKCDYFISICRIEGNTDQDLYVYHLITSRLTGRAAALISERQDLGTWPDLKQAFEQHFGDPRSEECIAIELETLKINNGESYLDFCNRIQHVKSTLIAKVNLIDDVHLRRSKITIYDHMSMNVFLYNLPEELLRIVRLKGSDSLEKALSIVLEEVNFLYQYNSKNKMLRSQNQLQPKVQTINQNPFIDKLGMKPFFTPNPQPQQGFKFGVPQNSAGTSNAHQPQTNFKFGIPPGKPFNTPVSQPHQMGYRPQIPQQLGYRAQFNPGQQQFGYKPSFNQSPPQFGYRPQLNQNQQQFGYRPQLNQGPQQFGYRPPFAHGQQFGYRPPQRLAPQISTDVSMRTAPQTKPQGFRMNELYNLNEPENDDLTYLYGNYDTDCYIDYNDCDPTDNADNYETLDNAKQDDQDPATHSIENFHISASNRTMK